MINTSSATIQLIFPIPSHASWFASHEQSNVNHFRRIAANSAKGNATSPKKVWWRGEKEKAAYIFEPGLLCDGQSVFAL